MSHHHYNPLVIGKNETVRLTGSKIGGFAAVTAGTLTLVDGLGNTILDEFPVAAGQWVDLPFTFTPGDQAEATCASDASGTLAV